MQGHGHSVVAGQSADGQRRRLGVRRRGQGVGGDLGRAVEAGEGLVAGGTEQNQLALLLVDACLCSDEVHPFLGLAVGGDAEVVVAGRREDAEDVVHLLLGVLLAGDGGDLGQVDLVPQLGLGLVLVDGQAVGAQDEVDSLPLL